MRSFLKPIALLSVIAVIFFAVYLMMKPGTEAVIGEDVVDEAPTTQTYDSAEFGLKFTYPDSYVLTEREEGTGERSRHSILLMDKIAAANIPEGGEGPTAITIDIFDNSIDKLPLETWIKNTSASNYKQSIDEVLMQTELGGQSGLSYVWDGLYRGESTVIARGDDILMFTVTWMDSIDPIRADFSALVDSVELRSM